MKNVNYLIYSLFIFIIMVSGCLGIITKITEPKLEGNYYMDGDTSEPFIQFLQGSSMWYFQAIPNGVPLMSGRYEIENGNVYLYKPAASQPSFGFKIENERTLIDLKDGTKFIKK